MMRSFARRVVTGLAAASFLVIGCSESPTPIPTASDSLNLRIVSLSPALTQILVDLGAGDQIVGIGEFDPVAPRHASVVGHFRQIDYEKLLAIRPTHIVLQDTAKEPISQKMLELSQRHGWSIYQIRLETSDDALEAVRTLAAAIKLVDRGEELAARFERQMKALADLTSPLSRTRVLIVVDSQPQIVAAAPGTFLDHVLHVAGAVNVIESSAVLYPMLDHERLLALQPRIIVHIRMPGSKHQLALPDALEADIVVLEDPAALLPSSSIPRIAARLARLLRPELSKEISAIFSLDN